jgi:hypothetical protein
MYNAAFALKVDGAGDLFAVVSLSSVLSVALVA